MKTTLLVARHGNTFAPGQVVTRVGGRTDLPLVESGLLQGDALGRWLRTANFLPDVVYTSRLQRAIQTAERALAAAELERPIEMLEIFNEIDYGPDENRPEVEVEARLGKEALTAWDERCVVPQGWTVDPAAIERNWVEFGAQLAAKQTGKTVLVVTSNGIARFSPHLTGDWEGFRQRHSLKISTGAVCRFEFENGKWTIAEWNVKPAKASA